jgi:hypothetical protein
MGRLLNGSCSGYLVLANAHIPEADVVFTGDFDHEASLLGLLGMKAPGELTAASAAPAIANGVYHATGTPVRNLPITVETRRQSRMPWRPGSVPGAPFGQSAWRGRSRGRHVGWPGQELAASDSCHGAGSDRCDE